MHKPAKTRYALICGFALAGTMGSVGVALAEQDQANEPTRAEELSQEVEQFNQNHGSLKEESAARSGAPTGHIDADGESLPKTPADHEKADELANEVRDYNRSGGSLNRDSAADSQVNDDLSTSKPVDHERADELSHEVQDFNKSGGSLNSDSAADSDLDDD